MKRLLIAASALALAPLAYAAEISVSFSEDFAETLEEDYGTREGEYLSREVAEDIERALTKAGVDAARIDVTIINAKPNKPTFKQLGDKPGLDFGRSLSIGGMKLEADAFSADGTELATLEYGWFENELRNAVGSPTWTDANRASHRFARKLAKALESQSS